MIEQLETQLGFIPTVATVKQKPMVCVEAGHIYVDETPTLKHEVGAIVGAKVCTVLEMMGIGVQRMLFVDDYNVSSNGLDLDVYQELLSKRGFTVDRLVMESSLAEDAERVIASLEQDLLTETNKYGAVILKKNHKKEKDIVLRKSPSMGATPACVALDTALYLKKYEDAGVCVTVLHMEWKGQQNGVKKVLKFLGKEVPILEVYYTDDGDIEVDFDY